MTGLEARIDADLALGRHDSLVVELDSLVAAHPYREGLRAQLMVALYRSGRQAEALETYRRARRTFSEELGIEPGPRLQELERAILRHDLSLEAPDAEAPGAREADPTETVRQRPRFLSRWAVVIAGTVLLVIVAALVAAARYSSGGSVEPIVLAGDSVAVIDPATNTIVGEIPVGDQPTGPAVGEGSVWVGNRDDNTLLRIDPETLDVVRTIGLEVAPIDVEMGAGSVWVLSDRALLRVDPAINDVVDTIPLPAAPGAGLWRGLKDSANALFVWSHAPGDVVRIDPATRSVVSSRRDAVWGIASGESALWVVTGWEGDTMERIDPKTSSVVETIPLGRVGETYGGPRGMVVGEGAIWVAFRASLWRIDSATKRISGSVPLTPSEENSATTGAGAVWVANAHGSVLRIDPDSQTVVGAIRLGILVYPVSGDALEVGEGSVWVSVRSFAS